MGLDTSSVSSPKAPAACWGRFGDGVKPQLEQVADVENTHRPADKSKTKEVVKKMESPREDNQWREVHENVELIDDVNARKTHDKAKGHSRPKIRRLCFVGIGVFSKKPNRKQVLQSAGKVITTKWIVPGEDHGG